MNKKSNKVNLIFCGAAFVIMLLFLFFGDGKNVAEAVTTMQIPFLLLAALFLIAYWLFDGICLHMLAKPLHPPQKFRNSFFVAVIGQYFNCITPFASGGQPFQTYYMMKFGATLGSSVTALIAKFIIYQFTLTVCSAVLLIARFSYFTNELAPLMFLSLIGFLINLGVMVFLFMIAFFRKAATAIAHKIIRILGKLRIIKDVDEKTEYIDNELLTYHENFEFLKKQPVIVFKVFVMTLLQLIIYFSISFIIYLGFGLNSSDYLTIISCQSFVLMISSFFPLPGALGAAEGSYAAFFGGIFHQFLGFSTFVWRFLTFYLPIIVGMVILLVLNGGKNTVKETNIN